MHDYLKISRNKLPVKWKCISLSTFLGEGSSQQNVEIVKQTYDSPAHCNLKLYKATLGLDISSVVGLYLAILAVKREKSTIKISGKAWKLRIVSLPA